jgi:hypothetical protein
VTTTPAQHGGEHRAVLVYQIESYLYWQEQPGRDAYGYGQQGRTSPSRARRAGIRMNDARIPALPVSHHRPAFYLRCCARASCGPGTRSYWRLPGRRR